MFSTNRGHAQMCLSAVRAHWAVVRSHREIGDSEGEAGAPPETRAARHLDRQEAGAVAQRRDDGVAADEPLEVRFVDGRAPQQDVDGVVGAARPPPPARPHIAPPPAWACPQPRPARGSRKWAAVPLPLGPPRTSVPGRADGVLPRRRRPRSGHVLRPPSPAPPRPTQGVPPTLRPRRRRAAARDGRPRAVGAARVGRPRPAPPHGALAPGAVAGSRTTPVESVAAAVTSICTFVDAFL